MFAFEDVVIDKLHVWYIDVVFSTGVVSRSIETTTCVGSMTRHGISNAWGKRHGFEPAGQAITSKEWGSTRFFSWGTLLAANMGSEQEHLDP